MKLPDLKTRFSVFFLSFTLFYFSFPAAGSVAAPAPSGGRAVKVTAENIPGVGTKFVFTRGKKPLATTALHAGRGAVWVGHDGAFSRLKTGSNEWKTTVIDKVACPSGRVASLAEDGAGGLWFRAGTEGGACRYKPSDGSWKELFDVHVIGGSKATTDGGRVFLTGLGGPDNEGVTVFDAATLDPGEYFHTKPIREMLVDGSLIWVGESAGLLMIDTSSGEYRYFLPRETGCGVETTAIVKFGGRLVIATRSGQTGYLGDKMVLSRDKLRVYIKRTGKWLEYGRDEAARAKLNEDIKNGALRITREMTRGGVCTYDKPAGKWKRHGAGDGLPSEEVDTAAAADGRLFMTTAKGIVILDSMGKFITANPAANSLVKQIKALEYDGKSLWILTDRAVYRASPDELAGR